MSLKDFGEKLFSRQVNKHVTLGDYLCFGPFGYFLYLSSGLALLIASFNTSLNNTFYITSSTLLSLYLNMISLFLLILILFFLFCSQCYKREKKKFELKKKKNQILIAHLTIHFYDYIIIVVYAKFIYYLTHLIC